MAKPMPKAEPIAIRTPVSTPDFDGLYELLKTNETSVPLSMSGATERQSKYTCINLAIVKVSLE